MTAYTHIDFPDFQLPSGRWCRIDMATQLVGVYIGAPYTTSVTHMTVNPWSESGLPQLVDEAAPTATTQNMDSVSFEMHNVPINPAVDNTTLPDLILSLDPHSYRWNIRIWVSASSVHTFPVPPLFWGVIDPTPGDVSVPVPSDRTWSTYTFNASNCISLGAQVTIQMWLNGTPGPGSFLDHAVYDITPDPTRIFVDGVRLKALWHNDGGSEKFVFPDSASSASADDPRGVFKFFRLRDVIYSMGAAMSITERINASGTGTGLVGSSWSYISINSPDPSPTETAWTFDDLVIPCAIYRGDGHVLVYDQSQGFFSPEKGAQSEASVWKCANILEAMKHFLSAHGLLVSVRTSTAGVRYLEVREREMTGASAGTEMLEDIKISSGEKGRYGFSVTTAMNGEISDGESGDENIDQPYIGATRIRSGPASDRYHISVSGPGDCGDEPAFFQSIFAYDAANNAVHSIFKITPRRNGDAATTARACMPHPPSVYPNWSNLTPGEATMEEGGSVFAKAAMAYAWNGDADPSVDPVGIARRFVKKLTWRESGIDLLSRVGQSRTQLGHAWVLRKITRDLLEDFTEYEGERGMMSSGA